MIRLEIEYEKKKTSDFYGLGKHIYIIYYMWRMYYII